MKLKHISANPCKNEKIATAKVFFFSQIRNKHSNYYIPLFPFNFLIENTTQCTSYNSTTVLAASLIQVVQNTGQLEHGENAILYYS